MAHLSRALLDGSRDLSTVPNLVKRVIGEDMWRQRVDPASGWKIPEPPFRTFTEFVGTPAKTGGLGSSVRQLYGLCEADPEARDAIDDQLQKEGRPGHRTDLGNNVPKVKRPEGNSEAKALRRLRKDRPDLHARVLAGELKANTAMVEAGFRHKTFTVRADSPQSAARTLRIHMKPEDLAELARILATT